MIDFKRLAPRRRLELRFTAPKAAVLPLDDRGVVWRLFYFSLHDGVCRYSDAFHTLCRGDETRDSHNQHCCGCSHQPSRGRGDSLDYARMRLVSPAVGGVERTTTRANKTGPREEFAASRGPSHNCRFQFAPTSGAGRRRSFRSRIRITIPSAGGVEKSIHPWSPGAFRPTKQFTTAQQLAASPACVVISV